MGDGDPDAVVHAVFFDLDDTLFDHRSSARAALADVHRRHAPAVDFTRFEDYHSQHLEALHAEVLAGHLSIDDARRERFRRVFAAVGIAVDADAVGRIAAAYRAGYVAARRVVEGAAALLEAVRPHARIAIVSNNLLDEQRDKLHFCGLAALVDELVVSEDVGVSKPDPGIFDAALGRLGVSAPHTVMFGDSWAADIVGAARAGIRAVWFNPEGRPRPAEPPDITEVRALRPTDDLVRVLLGAPLPTR
ncbi:MAG TPA: HAD-IA family hydrolase [Vicinamibacterales bacterium]|jgi:putative hydrolase of the HAD superfamily